MITIIQIALGILLAILILAALPLIVRAIGWVLVFVVVSVLLIALVWVGSSLTRIDPTLLVGLSAIAVALIVPLALERPLAIAFGTGATPWLQAAIAVALGTAAVVAASFIQLALSR